MRVLSRRVFYISFVLFALEILLFHALDYLTHYLEALLLLSYALLGIGMGAFLSTFLRRLSGDAIFELSLWGSLVTLVASLYGLLQIQSIEVVAVFLSLTFVFPGLYLARAFADGASGTIYFWDLLGASAGLAAASLFCGPFNTETLLLFVSLSLLVSIVWRLFPYWRSRWFPLAVAVLLTSATILATLSQWRFDVLNFYHLVVDRKEIGKGKVFQSDQRLIKSYDHLLGRVDIVQNDRLQKKRTYYAAYNGYPNDHFNLRTPSRYKTDIRVVTNLHDKPNIFLIGSSAQGVVKTARAVSPPQNIHAVEILPGVLKAMREDFIAQSNYAYEGIRVHQANAVPALEDIDLKFDIITLMNVHAAQRVGFLSGSDYVHTKENYRTMLEHLSESGYLMFEERPTSVKGEVTVYRMLNALYQVLEELGAEDPKKHFFIYGWRSGPSKGFQRYRSNTYMGILVKRNPITPKEKEGMLEFWNRIGGKKRFARPVLEDVQKRDESYKTELLYLNGFLDSSIYTDVFDAIESGELQDKLPQWDLSVPTIDRPYLTHIDTKHSELKGLMLRVGVFAFSLVALVWVYMICSQRAFNFALMGLSLYQMLVGFAFIIVETLFIEFYKQEFSAPSLAVLFVLGALLIGSGFGGQYYSRRSVSPVWVLLSLALVFLANVGYRYVLIDDLAFRSLQLVLSIFLVLSSGWFMGYFFPYGLDIAKAKRVDSLVPSYVALNTIAGAVAVPIGLYLSVQYGFIFVFALAFGCYVFATLFLGKIVRN